MDSQQQAGARIALIMAGLKCEKLRTEAKEWLARQVGVVEELAATVKEGSAEFYRLTHEGRCLDESDSRDYCGSCDLRVHIQQLRDPDSWPNGGDHGVALRKLEPSCLPLTVKRWLHMGVLKELNLGPDHTKELRKAIRGLSQ